MPGLMSVPLQENTLQMMPQAHEGVLMKAPPQFVCAEPISPSQLTKALDLQKLYPNFSLCDCIRFLQARRFDEKKAVKMIDAHLAWLDKLLIGGSTRSMNKIVIGFDDIKKFVSHRCWTVLGRGKRGRPVLFLKVANWKPNEISLEEWHKAIAYMLSGAAKMTVTTRAIGTMRV